MQQKHGLLHTGLCVYELVSVPVLKAFAELELKWGIMHGKHFRVEKTKINGNFYATLQSE